MLECWLFGHRGVENTRRYTPRAALTNIRGSAESVLQAAYGFTSIEMECPRCGIIWFVTAVGDQRIKK